MSKSIDEILDLIPEEDYEKIQQWRQDNIEGGVAISSRNLLTTWAHAKRTLVDLFGGELILTKSVKVERDCHELKNEFVDMLRWGDRELLSRLEVNLRRYMQKIGYSSDDYYSTCRYIFEYDKMISNHYNGKSIVLPADPSHKEFKITNGSKIMKVLRGLMTYFGFDSQTEQESFEHIRLVQSQINNNRYIEGKLSLSIHPLDYMTMSDNECNWSSCMSWAERGCYRQGTIEMMNSHCVVIAYLNATRSMSIGYNHTWTNKRWRELFIIDPTCIVGIKGYPYRSDEMALIVLDWLKQLATENLGWNYHSTLYNLENGGIICYPFEDSDVASVAYDSKGCKKCFNFVTNYMYNDFGCRHLIYVGENQLVDNHWDAPYTEIAYSGLSQCMACGETNIDIGRITSEASTITCEQCNPDIMESWYCEDCGRMIYDEDDVFTLDDTVYCSDCYNSLAATCVSCSNDHHREDMHSIVMISPFEEEGKADLTRGYVCTYCKNHRIMKPKDSVVKHLYKDEVNCLYVFENDIEQRKSPWTSYSYPQFDFSNSYPDDDVNIPDLTKIY